MGMSLIFTTVEILLFSTVEGGNQDGGMVAAAVKMNAAKFLAASQRNRD